MAMPHALERPSAAQKASANQLSICFRVARPPRAQSLPLVSRKRHVRWQLYRQPTLISRSSQIPALRKGSRWEYQ
jgi:hypothetical protein